MRFTDITGHAWDVQCMGCAIADGTMTPPGGIIATSGSASLHQDPEVPLEGFLVVGTARHVQSIADLTDTEYADFASLMRHGRRLMRSIPGIRCVTVVQEERSPHLHLWLFPWYDWMIETYGDTSLTNIRAIMKQARSRLNAPEEVRGIIARVEQLTDMSTTGGAS